MFKFIKGLFVTEPESPAPENLILFTPNDGSWDVRQVRRLFDAGLGRLHRAIHGEALLAIDAHHEHRQSDRFLVPIARRVHEPL